MKFPFHSDIFAIEKITVVAITEAAAGMGKPLNTLLSIIPIWML